MLRLLTDFGAGLSVTTWISGPLFEEFGLQPAIAGASSQQQKKALLAVYSSYSKIAQTGLVGLVLTDTIKFFFDGLRKKGTVGYQRWATIGDLVVLTSLVSGIVDDNLRKKLANEARGGAEAEVTQSQIGLTRRISLGLSCLLLWISAQQYWERIRSKAD